MKAEVTINTKGEQRLVLTPEDGVDRDFLAVMDDDEKAAPYLAVAEVIRDVDEMDVEGEIEEMTFCIERLRYTE